MTEASIKTRNRTYHISTNTLRLSALLGLALLMLSLLAPTQLLAQPDSETAQNAFVVTRVGLRQQQGTDLGDPIEKFNVTFQLRLHADKAALDYGFIRAHGKCVDNCTDAGLFWWTRPDSWKEEVVHIHRAAIDRYLAAAAEAGYHLGGDTHLFLDVILTPVRITTSRDTEYTRIQYRGPGGPEISYQQLVRRHDVPQSPIAFSIDLSAMPTRPAFVNGKAGDAEARLSNFGWRTENYSYTYQKPRFIQVGDPGFGPSMYQRLGSTTVRVEVEPTHHIHSFDRVVEPKINGEIDPDTLDINNIGRSETNAPKKNAGKQEKK